MEKKTMETIIRFARLFILSTIIVALAWMLLENEILGTVRNWQKDLMYAIFIGVCIAVAQMVLDPRPREQAQMAPEAASAANPMFQASIHSASKSKKKPKRSKRKSRR